MVLYEVGVDVALDDQGPTEFRHTRDIADLRRHRTRHKIRRASERVISVMQVTVAVCGLIIVILLTIPWLEEPLKKIGFASTGGVTEVILTFVVVSIFFEVRRLTERKPVQRRYFSNPIDAYPVLLERIRAISRKEQKVLDVLGLTLFTAWPAVRSWTYDSELDKWTLRFTAIDCGADRFSEYIKISSYRQAGDNLDGIVDFANSEPAAAHAVTLKAYAYGFMPSLHGFRLGNGDLFYSIVHWEDGKLSFDNFSYEFVPRDDHSKSAEAIREIFDSWFQRAATTEWQVRRGEIQRSQ